MLRILITLLLLAMSVLAQPTPATNCDLSSATLVLPSNQTVLVEPQGPPSFIAVAFGVQNYTCNATSLTYSNIGAVGELFDISCLYGKDEFSSIQDHLYNAWNETPANITIQDLISVVGDKPQVLGQHYYVPNPKPTAGGPAISPKWDFTSDSERGKPDAFVIAASVGTLPAPNSTDNINWVQLKNIEGKLADSVYRVDTKGGQPPTSCTAGAPLLSVKYAAKYWLFGGEFGH